MGTNITALRSVARPDERSPVTGDRCRRCRHNPASARIFGYCSWDCHDSDGDEDDEKEAA